MRRATLALLSFRATLALLSFILASLLLCTSSFAQDSIVMCGNSSPCTSGNTDITCSPQCAISGNTILFGVGQNCVFANAPIVVVSNNTCNLALNTVSSIDFGGSSSASYPPGQPGPVATLAVHMSGTSWQFPFPPGSLSIGGANSGGFTICNSNQICGSPSGSHNDFSIVATLHGMAGSPVTIPAGTLTLFGSTVLQAQDTSHCIQAQDSTHCVEGF